MTGNTVTDQGQADDIGAALLALLHEAPEPLTIAKIRAGLPAELPLSEGRLIEMLDRQSARGMIFRFAPYRSEGVRYWSQAVDAYAAQIMIAELSAAPLSMAALDKKVAARLTDCPAAQRKDILEGLLRDGKVHRLPSQPGERAALYRSGAPDLLSFYRPVVTEFAVRVRAITDHFASMKVPLRDCWTAIDELLDETLFTESEGREKHQPDNDAEDDTSSDLRELVLDRLKVATTTQRRGGLISLRELRQSMPDPQPGKPEFDACVLDLAKDGMVWLYRHDYAASLSVAEREALVSDARGNYYNGVSLRG